MIDLSKILSHLPKEKIEELETVTERIILTGKAEIILLFGSYARGNYKLKRSKENGKKSDYDILVATSDADTRKGLIRKLRGVFRDVGVPVQLVVEKIKTVNRNLVEEQYFYTDIKREGKLLYTSGNFELSESMELTPTRRREIAEEDFDYWKKQAISFFRSANHDISDTEFRTASFHLQQTVEMCYSAIEMVFDHYNPHEHNLKTLRYRVLKFDHRIGEALPYETEDQIELFDDLNLAYIGGRYRSEDEYSVTKYQLDYWSVEIKKLLEITETICKERIENLKEIENKNK